MKKEALQNLVKNFGSKTTRINDARSGLNRFF